MTSVQGYFSKCETTGNSGKGPQVSDTYEGDTLHLWRYCWWVIINWDISRHIVDKTGIFKLTSSFAHLNQVFFVHKPSQSKSTALLQLKVKNWALWNLKLWHEEVSSFNMSVVLQKCILPTAILGGHFFSFTSLTAVVGWILLPVVPVFSNCYVQYELASAPSVPSCLHTACSTAFCLPCFFLPNKDRLWSWFDLHRPWYPFLC